MTEWLRRALAVGRAQNIMNKLLKSCAALLLAAAPSPASQTTTNLPPWPIVQFWGGGRHSMALLADGSV